MTQVRGGRLDGAVWKVAGAVVLGSAMAMLDSTIVNVALQTMAVEFRTSFAAIQWTATAYLLALAMAIPITGWASDRLGGKRLYLLAIALFVLGSVLASGAWDLGSLIAFRVLQGFGGGLLGPAGTAIVVRAAGPDQVGRVMAILGVPMLVGPIAGPALGGWLIDAAGWRWLFLVNLPVGVVAYAVARRTLPAERPRPAGRFDFAGLALLSPGLALLIFGAFLLSGGTDPLVAAVVGVAGALGIAGFVLRGRRIANPLIDLGLFRNRGFALSTAALALFFVGFLGSGVLFPAYFLLARGESTLTTGLLLAPSGLAALISIPVAGKLADQVGPHRLVLPGLLLIIAGMAVFTRVGPGTPYALLVGAQFVLGLGMGAAFLSLMAAALRTLPERSVAAGSTALSVLQQAFSATGTATLSILLAGLLAARFGVPIARGQLAATEAVSRPGGAVAAGLVADSFALTFLCAFVLLVLALVPALALLRSSPKP